MKSNLPDVTTYTDFRQYLKDCYEEKKKSDPKFSHRYFCKKLATDPPALSATF